MRRRAHRLVHLLVREDLLDVLQLLERVVKLDERPCEAGLGDGNRAHGDVGYLGAFHPDSLVLKGVRDPVERVDVAPDLEPVPGRDDVVRPGLERDLDQRVLGRRALRDKELPRVACLLYTSRCV